MVTLRPTTGIRNTIRAIMVAGDLAFLSIPAALVSGGAAMLVVGIVIALACIALVTYFGLLLADTRVEVDTDTVTIHYFLPRPKVVPRSSIADIQMGRTPYSAYGAGGGTYLPRIMLHDGRVAPVFPLAAKNEAVVEEQIGRLRQALDETA
jgi:hypothetical protein